MILVGSVMRHSRPCDSTIVSKDLTKTYKAVIGKRMMVASLLGRGFDAGRWHVSETLPFGTCSVDP